LFNLVSADRDRLLGAKSASVSALRLFEQLPRHPIVTVASAMKLIDASKPTATRAIAALAEVGVLVETTGKKRDRSFAYRAYMERLREEAAPTDLVSAVLKLSEFDRDSLHGEFRSLWPGSHH
jgi:hypothetical protein